MKNGILRYTGLLSLLLFFLVACHEEGQLSKGKGRLILGDVEISIGTVTRAFSVPPLSESEIIIDLIDPFGDIIETGNLDHYKNGIELFAATYTIKAHYGTKAQMSTTPYYEGNTTFTLAENETKNIVIEIALANAIIIPQIPDDLSNHYNDTPTFYVAYNEQKVPVANGEALYVLPEKVPYTLTLEGKNKANVDVIKNIKELNAKAEEVYNINCSLTLPILTLPEQQNGAWAKRLYITPVIAKDQEGNVTNAPKGIIYEIIPESSSDWSTATTIQDNGNQNKIVFTGLSKDTKYKVRARLGNEIVTTPIDFKTEDICVIPNGSLDQYSIIAGADNDNWGGGSIFGNNGCGAVYQFYADKNAANSWWRTNNETKCPSNKGYIYSWSSRSGTRPDSRAKNGECANIMTSGYGITGGLLTPPSMPNNITAGKLYTDKVSINSRPSALAFYYKYIPQDDDTPIIKINIYNNNTIIGSAQLSSPSYNTEYQEQKTKLEIDYKNEMTTRATHLEIIFESGTNTNVTKRHSDKNDPMPMFVGSQLFIDEVELIYE